MELSTQYGTASADVDIPIPCVGFPSGSAKPILLLVAEPAGVHRPRHPEQTAFYQLGTPKEHKVLRVFDTDHWLDRKDLIRESLAWLDKYLGPVMPSTSSE